MSEMEVRASAEKKHIGQKSAEVIVAEPNHVAMTNHVVCSEA